MQTIDIRTTQNVTIEYELASLRERVIAFCIDLIIIGTIYVILLAFVSNVFGQDSSDVIGFLVGIFPLFAFLCYHLFSEILANGQSWGKKAMGIKVVRLDGQEPGLSDFLLRAIFHIVDSVISIGIVAALLISSSGKNQRLGDITANTTVIRTKHNLRFRLMDILKINTLDDYEPKYPAVRKLSEQDMLLIKGIINRQRNHPNAAHNEALDLLVNRLCSLLEVEKPARRDRIDFLKTLIRDYIVLTR